MNPEDLLDIIPLFIYKGIIIINYYELYNLIMAGLLPKLKHTQQVQFGWLDCSILTKLNMILE